MNGKPMTKTTQTKEAKGTTYETFRKDLRNVNPSPRANPPKKPPPAKTNRGAVERMDRERPEIAEKVRTGEMGGQEEEIKQATTCH